jgi:ketosteroid isomerase-like protein
MYEQDNERLIETFMQLLSDGQVDRAFELLSNDLEWKVVATSRPAVLTKGQLKAAVTAMISVFIDGSFRMSPVGMVASGTKVAVESESYAKIKGGKIYNNKYHSLFFVQDGKITQVREYADTAHVIDVLIPAIAASRSK